MGDNLSKKIDEAIDICTYGYINNSFKLLYSFTTENISEYLSILNCKGKSLLTVGSSCDQVFNAILSGVTDISVIDLCPYVKEYYYLKKAAIEKFSRDEFLRFMSLKHYPGTFDDNYFAFNKDLYLALRNNIKNDDYESYLFWDKLFSEFDGFKIRTELFNHDEYNKRVKCVVNDYLKSDVMFEKLKSKLSSSFVNFEVGDIFDTEIDGKYDNIILSNLCAYYSSDKMIDLISKMTPVLKKDGMLLACYIYSSFVKSGYYNELFDILDNFIYNFEKFSFLGIKGIQHKDDSIRDMAIVYKKVLKKI